MANLSAAKTFCLLAVLGGCGVRVPPGSRRAPVPASVQPTIPVLEGNFLTSDGQRENLANLGDKPLLLIFSQDTCIVCAAEARLLREKLKDPARAPGRIYVATLLVGAILDDAVDWKENHQIPWTVGIPENISLYKKLCPAGTVPCLLIQVPGRGVVFQGYGKNSFEDIEKLTGPWD